jgi:hypothetical protein
LAKPLNAENLKKAIKLLGEDFWINN